MFSRTLAEMLLVYFLIIWLFQPLYHELNAVRRAAVEETLNMGLMKASSTDNGCFTPEIIDEMKTILHEKFFIPEGDIQFSGTTTPTPRGEYIEGTLSIKAPPRWIFPNMFGSNAATDDRIVSYGTIMSEYVVRSTTHHLKPNGF